MASWRKYFTTVPSQQQLTRKLEQMNRENGKAGTSHKFSSYLPEVYSGAPNRIERYVQYDQADLDSEINRALDTIAEFCTQNWSDDDLVPFRLIYNSDDLTETEIHLLNTSLNQWCRINKFNQRIFRTFRNALKYGDQIFIRDPETLELLWVDSAKVEKIIVNEAEGKAIESYVIRDLDFNMQNMTATNSMVQDNYSFPGGYPRSSNPAAGAGNINYGQPTTPGGRTSRFYNPANSVNVAAEHVVHLSLSEGMDQYWPFGISVLEAVYKTYKQKDLLEDCILIYRIVRAPERRVFYIDVGQLQGQRAMAYVERVKNEIYQRRIPNRGGGGQSVLDTAYNPISITEDFFLATNTEQRGTRIESLAAGENLGSIDDLRYFTNKLMRGLGIPSSYLPTGPDDGTAIYNDGKVGTAFIQEYRFNKYCQRLQNSLSPTLDREFKLFLKHKGIEIPANQFTLAFNPPQSFSEYRSMALDQERINVFSSIMNTDAVKYLSKRYALERYLGWTQEDILTNERMWKEENAERVRDQTGVSPLDQDQVGLRGIGIKPDMTDDDMGLGMDMGMEPAPPEPVPDQTANLGGAPAPTPAPPTPTT
jgi:hypothetical protein